MQANHSWLHPWCLQVKKKDGIAKAHWHGVRNWKLEGKQASWSIQVGLHLPYLREGAPLNVS